MHKLPILITFYNRPSHLEKLLISLKDLSGIELYFASDGPLTSQDKLYIDACLQLTEKYFRDTPKKRYLQREQNVGCKLAMKTNIDWFYDNVPYGIVLEDDCIPSKSFIKLTEKMLKQYRSKPSYMSINGTSFFPRNNSKFVFRETFFPLVWGWGTWASQWKKYQLNIPDARSIVESASNRIFGTKFSMDKKFFEDVFTTRFMEVEKGQIDTWDYSLTASAWRLGIKSLQFNNNSVLNIGFDSSATHTVTKKPKWVPTSYVEVDSFDYNIQQVDYLSEKWVIKNVYQAGFKESLKNQIKRIIR